MSSSDAPTLHGSNNRPFLSSHAVTQEGTMEAAAAAVHNQSLLGRSTGPGGHGNGGGGAMGATAATASYTRTATAHPNAERVNLATRFPLEALLHHQRMSMMGARSTSNGTLVLGNYGLDGMRASSTTPLFRQSMALQMNAHAQRGSNRSFNSTCTSALPGTSSEFFPRSNASGDEVSSSLSRQGQFLQQQLEHINRQQAAVGLVQSQFLQANADREAHRSHSANVNNCDDPASTLLALSAATARCPSHPQQQSAAFDSNHSLRSSNNNDAPVSPRVAQYLHELALRQQQQQQQLNSRPHAPTNVNWLAQNAAASGGLLSSLSQDQCAFQCGVYGAQHSLTRIGHSSDRIVPSGAASNTYPLDMRSSSSNRNGGARTKRPHDAVMIQALTSLQCNNHNSQSLSLPLHQWGPIVPTVPHVATHVMNQGPFPSPIVQQALSLPALLFAPSDTTKLSRVQIMLRQQVEAFQATETDVTTHVRGRNKTIRVGQVGIRCRHCASQAVLLRGKGSTYFPTSVWGFYQASQNMGAMHLQNGVCHVLPDSIQASFTDMMSNKKDYKSPNSGAGRAYWAATAQKMGLVDLKEGVFFICDLPKDVSLPDDTESPGVYRMSATKRTRIEDKST